MPEAELPRDHFVSRGYQQNFASAGKRVAVFNARYGRVVDLVRPIKSNFREQGFTAFLDAGVPNDAPHSSCSTATSANGFAMRTSPPTPTMLS